MSLSDINNSSKDSSREPAFDGMAGGDGKGGGIDGPALTGVGKLSSPTSFASDCAGDGSA